MAVGCRVGKVTFRNGTTLNVLRSERELNSDWCREKFFKSAYGIADEEPMMTGYFMVAWSSGERASVTDSVLVTASSDRGYFDIPGFVHSVATKAVDRKLE